jgi:uncharacterized protein (TIGR00645 family)
MSVTDTEKRIRWLGKLDTGTLKIKLSTSIVTISGVHLLKIFMTLNRVRQRTTVLGMWRFMWSLSSQRSRWPIWIA